LSDEEIEYRSSKTEILKQITHNFSEFDKLQEKISLKIGNEYFKNFIKLIKKNKNDGLDSLETPLFVLIQRSYYLKGKTALYCKDYEKALIFFYRSENVYYIGDGKLIQKSINKIIFILKLTMTQIETSKFQDGKLLSKTNQSINSPGKGSKNNLQIYKKEDINKFNVVIDYWEKKLDKFSLNERDVLVLVNNNIKKMDKAVRLSQQIFKTLITTEDKFGVFIFGKNLNPIVQLSRKAGLTYKFIKNEIKNLETSVKNADYEEDAEVYIKKCIFKSFSYLKQKSNTYLQLYMPKSS